MSIKPLDGIRVLDATSNIAGPFGGAVLADLGAEVIKIETPTGDPARSMAPIDGERSAYFNIVNRNKLVRTIDFKSQEGRAEFDQLLANADVFLTNFLPDRLKALDLLPETLMKQNPQLIFGNLTSYGSKGKDSGIPGYDATVQARTGIMYVTGEPEGQPVRAGVSVLDIGAGTWLATGVLAAIIQRTKTGKGSLIETSLFETGVSWVSYHLAAFQISGIESVRSGAGHPTFSPYGIFATKSGEICIGVGSDAVFAKLCHQIDRLDLISNPLYAENVGRVANRNLLHIEIEKALASNTAIYWAKRLGENSVPADLVVPPEALLKDPQVKEIGALLPNPDTSSKVKWIPGLPFTIDGVRPEIYRSAPNLDK